MTYSTLKPIKHIISSNIAGSHENPRQTYTSRKTNESTKKLRNICENIKSFDIRNVDDCLFEGKVLLQKNTPGSDLVQVI